MGLESGFDLVDRGQMRGLPDVVSAQDGDRLLDAGNQNLVELGAELSSQGGVIDGYLVQRRLVDGVGVRRPCPRSAD